MTKSTGRELRGWLQPGGSHHILQNRRKLAALLKARIDWEFGGSVNAASKACHISQPQLRRLTKGMVTRRVTNETFQRLVAFLGDPASSNEIFSRQSAHTAIALYYLWGVESEHRVIEGPMTAMMPLSRSPDGSSPLRAVELQAILKRISKSDALVTVRTEMRDLLSAPTLSANEKWALDMLGGPSLEPAHNRRVGIQSIRYYIAVLRTIEPLLDAPATAWIERRQSEMSDGEFAEFIKAGWRRETLLLRRAGDAERSEAVPLLKINPRLTEPFQVRVERSLRRTSVSSLGGGLRKVVRSASK